MHVLRIWSQPDLFARFELVALAEDRDDFFPAEIGEDLGLRAGRLDDNDFSFGAFVLISKSIAFRVEARDYISSFTSEAAGTSKVQHDVVVLTGISFGL